MEKLLFDIDNTSNWCISHIDAPAKIKNQLYELGFLPGVNIKFLYTSALGDPSAYKILETTIALRNDTAKNIYIYKS